MANGNGNRGNFAGARAALPDDGAGYRIVPVVDARWGKLSLVDADAPYNDDDLDRRFHMPERRNRCAHCGAAPAPVPVVVYGDRPDGQPYHDVFGIMCCYRCAHRLVRHAKTAVIEVPPGGPRDRDAVLERIEGWLGGCEAPQPTDEQVTAFAHLYMSVRAEQFPDA